MDLSPDRWVEVEHALVIFGSDLGHAMTASDFGHNHCAVVTLGMEIMW